MISCGDSHTLLALGPNRDMWAMGYASKGRLGVASLVDGYGLAAPDDSKAGEDDDSDYDSDDDSDDVGKGSDDDEDGGTGSDKKLDYDEFGDKVTESLVTRNPICQGSIHDIVMFDAGKWDREGTSVAVIAPSQVSRFGSSSGGAGK